MTPRLLLATAALAAFAGVVSPGWLASLLAGACILLALALALRRAVAQHAAFAEAAVARADAADGAAAQARQAADRAAAGTAAALRAAADAQARADAATSALAAERESRAALVERALVADLLHRHARGTADPDAIARLGPQLASAFDALAKAIAAGAVAPSLRRVPSGSPDTDRAGLRDRLSRGNLPTKAAAAQGDGRRTTAAAVAARSASDDPTRERRSPAPCDDGGLAGTAGARLRRGRPATPAPPDGTRRLVFGNGRPPDDAARPASGRPMTQAPGATRAPWAEGLTAQGAGPVGASPEAAPPPNGQPPLCAAAGAPSLATAQGPRMARRSRPAAPRTGRPPPAEPDWDDWSGWIANLSGPS